MLYNCVSAQGYKECQEDISDVSGMAEEIRDAVIDYQVGRDQTDAAAMQLKPRCFDRCPNNRRYMIRIAN